MTLRHHGWVRTRHTRGRTRSARAARTRHAPRSITRPGTSTRTTSLLAHALGCAERIITWTRSSGAPIVGAGKSTGGTRTRCRARSWTCATAWGRLSATRGSRSRSIALGFGAGTRTTSSARWCAGTPRCTGTHGCAGSRCWAGHRTALRNGGLRGGMNLRARCWFCLCGWTRCGWLSCRWFCCAGRFWCRFRGSFGVRASRLRGCTRLRACAPGRSFRLSALRWFVCLVGSATFGGDLFSHPTYDWRFNG